MAGFTWCSGMGPGGWLVMIAAWATFLSFAVWAITRIFPLAERSPIPSPTSIEPVPPAPPTDSADRVMAGRSHPHGLGTHEDNR